MSALDKLIAAARGDLPMGPDDPDMLDECESELATLRANQLSPAIVDAVKAYQAAHVAYVKFIDALRDPGAIPESDPIVFANRRAFKAVYRAIEADAKECEG